jgi:hypothetical protein
MLLQQVDSRQRRFFLLTVVLLLTVSLPLLLDGYAPRQALNDDLVVTQCNISSSMVNQTICSSCTSAKLDKVYVRGILDCPFSGGERIVKLCYYGVYNVSWIGQNNSEYYATALTDDVSIDSNQTIIELMKSYAAKTWTCYYSSSNPQTMPRDELYDAKSYLIATIVMTAILVMSIPLYAYFDYRCKAPMRRPYDKVMNAMTNPAPKNPGSRSKKHHRHFNPGDDDAVYKL